VIFVIKPIIEFCVSNLASGSQKAMEILEKDYDLDVIEYGCLSHCGLCAETLFALVNGEVVTGDTPQELVENCLSVYRGKPDVLNDKKCGMSILRDVRS